MSKKHASFRPSGEASLLESAVDFEEPAQEVVPDTCYQCPLYRTAERKGALKTTGHSTNFIMYVQVPMPMYGELGIGGQDKDRKTVMEQKRQSHWIKRGAALLCQLSH